MEDPENKFIQHDHHPRNGEADDAPAGKVVLPSTHGSTIFLINCLNCYPAHSNLR